MPDRSSKPAERRDLNQRAYDLVRAVTEEEDDTETAQTESDAEAEERRKAAATLGRRGGLKGGKARAAKMTAEERSEAAKKAAAGRWGKR